jgi:3,4-dihydroxy 2-butanone 4-phosphate synthase/GTP cyclohydrolase II
VPFDSIETCLDALRDGQMIILVDDEDRENEGDIIAAGEFVTPSMINFMLTEGRGMLFVALDGETADRLKLVPQASVNTAQRGTAYTVSVDASSEFGITTGVSATERATTIRRLADPRGHADDFDRPGHVHPLRARDGGTLVRAGHTEGMTDLCRLAGLRPVGVGIEVMRADGEMARRPDLEAFATKHDLRMCTVADLIRYRTERETLINRVETVRLPTRWGAFTLHAYDSAVDQTPHLALVRGDDIGRRKPDGSAISTEKPTLVRVHSECLTGDVFGSGRCDCGDQLDQAMQRIDHEGRGVLLYLRQEGRGIGLTNKLHAYRLQDEGLDTVEANLKLGLPADRREYGIGVQILKDLGLKKLRVLTNNPKKIYGIEGHGLKVVEQLPVHVTPTRDNAAYLATKREKMGHSL